MYPYIGDASGSHPVPEPFLFMGRFNEYEWVIGTMLESVSI
jgi:hypothetical protein